MIFLRIVLICSSLKRLFLLLITNKKGENQMISTFSNIVLIPNSVCIIYTSQIKSPARPESESPEFPFL